MGRTNFIILGFGIAACVVLSLLMQHAVKVQRDADTPAIVGELTNLFGSQFADPPEFSTSSEEHGLVGELVVYPLLSSSRKRVVRSVGEYVWRNLGEKHPIDALIVETDDGLGRRFRFVVPQPHEFGKRLRELKPGESPFVRSTPKPTPIKKSRPAASRPTSSRPAAASRPTTRPAPAK